MILYGAPVREKIKKELMKKVKKLGRRPVLAIVQVGDREDSNIYVRNKIKFGGEIGVRTKIEKFKIGKLKNLEKKIIRKIRELNKDKNINGIIVQLPLPDGIDTEKILNCISTKKDADGLVSKPNSNIVPIVPATARAVMTLLDFYRIQTEKKKVVVIGRSRLAGGPIAEEFKKRRCLVKVCHRGTKNMAEICKKADILVSATGKADLVTKQFVKMGQIVVDVGINRTPKGILVGDVKFNEVKSIVKAITPVPGGVGPLTVACLFENLIDLCYHDR